jgi:hypothetical protein
VDIDGRSIMGLDRRQIDRLLELTTASRWAASRSSEPGHRCASVAPVVGVNADAHRRQHALHAPTDVIDGDNLHLLIAQETRDPRVVGTLGPAVV